MKPGRSAGRQVISTSFITWPMMPPESFTAGEISWLTKRSGTRMVIFSSAATRWKSMWSTCGLYGCHCTSRSSTRSLAPSISMSRIDEWNPSTRSA